MRTLTDHASKLNASKNLKRAELCATRNETWRSRQQWALHVHSADGASHHVASLADPATAKRYLECIAHQRVALVGDSYLGQLFSALLRALLASSTSHAGVAGGRPASLTHRWLNRGQGLVDYNGGDYDSQPRIHFVEANSTLVFHRCNFLLKCAHG